MVEKVEDVKKNIVVVWKINNNNKIEHLWRIFGWWPLDTKVRQMKQEVYTVLRTSASQIACDSTPDPYEHHFLPCCIVAAVYRMMTRSRGVDKLSTHLCHLGERGDPSFSSTAATAQKTQYPSVFMCKSRGPLTPMERQALSYIHPHLLFLPKNPKQLKRLSLRVYP